MTTDINDQHNLRKGIHLDCLKLIDNFTKRNNPEFKIFCLDWKLLQFHHIYCCQLNEMDMVQTTMEIFKFCKKILTKDDTKLRKIGSIYLLYSLYYKQPTAMYVKIQVNLITWRIIKNFIDSLANDNYIQAKYIFWKLVSDNAFRFVESEIYFGLEPFFNKEQDYAHQTSKQLEEDNILNKEIINLLDKNEGFIKGFELLEKSYNNMKNIINENNVNEKNFVAIESTKFINDIQNDILSINEIFNPKATNSATEKKNNKITKNIKERRSEIRKKAYSKDIQIPGTSKNNVVVTAEEEEEEASTDNNSEIEDNVEPQNIERVRRVSKLNQIKILFQDPLPDEFKKELGDEHDE